MSYSFGFSQRLAQNPIMRDVLAHIKASNKKFAIAVTKSGIKFYSLGTFNQKQSDEDHSYSLQFLDFSFTGYGYKQISSSQQKAIADYLHTQLSYRNQVCVRPWYNHYYGESYHDFAYASFSQISASNIFDVLIGNGIGKSEFLCYTIDYTAAPSKQTTNLRNW